MLNWIQYEPVKYGKYEFSSGAQGFGWCIAVVSIIVIPLGAIHTLIKSEGKTLKEKLLLSIKPQIHDLDHKMVDNRSHGLKSSYQIDPETVHF